MGCMFCDHGQVELMIAGEVVEVIDCPHCGQDQTEQEAMIEAARAADREIGNEEPFDFGELDG